MRKGNIFLLTILVLALTVILSGCGSSRVEINRFERTYTLEQLKEDYLQLSKAVEKKHPNLYHSREEVQKVFEDQYELLKDDMTELDFYRVLSPILPVLGCGHTNVYISEGYEDYLRQYGEYLPFSVRLIDERLFVLENLSDSDIPAGSELISINGRSIKDILQILYKNLPSDGYNLTKKQYILNNWFNASYYYFVENPGVFAIEYYMPGKDQLLSAIVPAVRDSKMHMTTMGIHFNEIDERVYFSEMKEDYARLVVRSFQSSRFKGKDYKRFLDDFFAQLEKREVKHLIIDLRGNWGGSPDPAAYLFTYLINEPTAYFKKAPFYYAGYKRPLKPKENRFKGRVYILTDGASFSTTGHLVSLIKHHGLGTFVGEESGGGAVVTDGGKNITLKHTRLRVYCATSVFMAAAEGLTEGRGVIPDHVVDFSLQDYMDGNDPQLQKVVELIEGS